MLSIKMPPREEPLITDEIYHVVNHSVTEELFRNSDDYWRYLETITYYKNVSPPVRFSIFNKATPKRKKEILDIMGKRNNFWVAIISYCLMPNHYHLLLKQTRNDGIFNFIRLVCNSYSKYFNTKYERKGPLFQNRFQAVRIKSDEQLLHVSRYIHLNPYTSSMVKNFKRLAQYPFSSFPEYLGSVKEGICDKNIILSQFTNISFYKKFTFNNADYQRSLEQIKKDSKGSFH